MATREGELDLPGGEISEARFDADYLRNPAPVYPPVSRRRGEQGEVRLRVWVSVAGAADRVAVHQSSGFSRLDEAAVRAVSEWRFVPARQGGRAVAAQVIVPVEFRLGG
ncbi:MAG TPA: energy transducer TonB [Azoarcus taiwanensis]|nr:energy transducer TonB [Azoarcus taiwanensis]